jgi:tetratricopeptide (TPR) repeat protein
MNHPYFATKRGSMPEMPAHAYAAIGEITARLLARLGMPHEDEPTWEDVVFRSLLQSTAYTIALHAVHMATLDGSLFTLNELAVKCMEEAYSDGMSAAPSHEEQAARVLFALRIDPTCGDAWLIAGILHTEAGNYAEAQACLDEARERFVQRIDPQRLAPTGKRSREQWIWYFTGDRDYMRTIMAQAELARAQGNVKHAIDRYQELLRLNPGDNMGIRDVLMGYALETDHDAVLRSVLKRYATWEHIDGVKEAANDTIHQYNHAILLFRTGGASPESHDALHAAFAKNRHIPAMLVFALDVPSRDELGPYAHGSLTEAALYVALSRVGWQRTPGAIAWLTTEATVAGLLTKSQRRFHAAQSEEPIYIQPPPRDPGVFADVDWRHLPTPPLTIAGQD